MGSPSSACCCTAGPPAKACHCGPALLVVGVNVVLAIKLVLEVKAKRANRPGNPGAHGPR